MHLLSLHIIPVNMTCLPIFGTHYIYVLTLFLHETTSLLYPASITYDESPLFAPYTTKKDTSVTFWAERFFFLSCLWHFFDDNCDKTRYHHRCGGLLLLWQKIMTENGFSSWVGLRRAAWHSLGRPWRKNRGRSEGEENIGVFPVTFGGWGRAMCVSLVHARALVRGVGI